MENELVDQFLGNRQNYMMDNNSIQQLNVASADDGVVGGMQAEVVSGVAGEILGGKYDEHHEEHDIGDDDESKYVEEVQQSEKQQQQQLQTLKSIGLEDDGRYESNDLAEKEASSNAAHEFGNGNGGFVFGGDHHSHEQQQQHDLFNMGNGHGTNGHDFANIGDDFGTLVPTGFEEKLNMMESDLDGFKNEGDFSSISNATEPAEDFVPQVDVKIEAKVEQHELVDEEEPSSMATNTTNGTSSLSENIPPQANIETEANATDDLITNLEDKENLDPHILQRPHDLDLEQTHSQLNPDAKEFVPSFGSNPASPTSPFATEVLDAEPVLSETVETRMYFGQAPVVAPRYLQEDDDFVAQSPCKGKDDNNMDTVFVPRELSEFEIEADKRPHELEPEAIEGFIQIDEVMTPDQAIQQLPLDDIETQDKENQATPDSTDFQRSAFIDHGPETCVDHETDLDMPEASPMLTTLQAGDDVMKRSMYVTGDDAIEDVLNSVQPIPTEIDSVNNSFIEESATESAFNQLAVDKELLQVEEKEHVSHSPSTEEIQMNLQNNLNSSNKDIPQIPIDMQQSLFMEQQLNSQLDQEQNEKLFSENTFETEEMFNSQQQPTAEEVEKAAIFHKELEPYNTTLLDDQNLLEENQIKEKQNQINEQQQCIGITSDGPEENKVEEEHYHIEKKQQIEETSSADNQTNEEQYEIHEKQHVAATSEWAEVNEIKEIHEERHIEETSVVPEINPFKDRQYKLDEIQHTEETIEHQKPCNQLLANDDPNELTTITDPGTENVLEEQIDVAEPSSPFKISAEVSNTTVLESLNNEAPDNLQQPDISNTHTLESLDNNEPPANLQQVDYIDVDMTEPTSFTANEKHLLEETKEQQMFSISGLEQQMSELILNNTGGSLSQTEEVAAGTATAAIEDAPEENPTKLDEAIDLDEQNQYCQEEHEQTDQLTLVDDSFNRHEEESLQQYLQEQKDQEMAAETEIQSNLMQKSLETPATQQHEKELESIVVAAEEPVIEAQHATILTSHEETEIKTEEKHELSMVPETTPAEVLEPTMTTNTETDIKTETETELIKKQEESSEPSEEAEADIVKEPELKEQTESIPEALKEDIVAKEEIPAEVPTEAAVVAAAAAVATATAVAAIAASSPSAKKALTKTTAKPAAAKKPTEAAKKPIAPAAKPRTAPAKPTGVTSAEKKTSTTTTNRKPTTTSKVVAKTTTTTTTARTVTAAPKPTTTTSKPTATPRTVPSSTLTARKPAATNGSLAKPRPASAPTKPTTLGLSAPKTKPLSPRSTLTSQQVRKTNPPATMASRTKTVPSTTSSTAGTASKTFTARPAPKFTSSSSATTTATRRSTAAGSTTSSTTAATLKPSTTTPMRKSTPTKPGATKTPTKPTTAAGGVKTKSPPSKTASPAAKPAPIRKPVDKITIAAATNGEADNKQLNGLTEQQQQQQKLNGDMQAVQQEKQQNGDSSIPKQTENLEQPFLENRYEKLPMDLINA